MGRQANSIITRIANLGRGRRGVIVQLEAVVVDVLNQRVDKRLSGSFDWHALRGFPTLTRSTRTYSAAATARYAVLGTAAMVSGAAMLPSAMCLASPLRCG